MFVHKLKERRAQLGRRAALVLLLDNIVAECEATKTRLARFGPAQRSEEGWVVTKL